MPVRGNQILISDEVEQTLISFAQNAGHDDRGNIVGATSNGVTALLGVSTLPDPEQSPKPISTLPLPGLHPSSQGFPNRPCDMASHFHLSFSLGLWAIEHAIGVLEIPKAPKHCIFNPFENAISMLTAMSIA